MKNLPTDEGDGEENRKIISVDIVDEKTFQPGLRTGKEQPEIDGEEGLGWNKVLFSFGVELQMATPPNAGIPALPAPGRQISGYPLAFGSRKPN